MDDSMTTFAWQFDSFDCYPMLDEFSDVVVVVHWRYIAHDESGNTASVSGEQSLSFDATASSFIAFADLTPDVVVEWIESAMGVAKLQQLQSALLLDIEKRNNPSVVRMLSPWQHPTFT